MSNESTDLADELNTAIGILCHFDDDLSTDRLRIKAAIENLGMIENYAHDQRLIFIKHQCVMIRDLLISLGKTVLEESNNDN